MLDAYRNGGNSVVAIDSVFPSQAAYADFLFNGGEEPRITFRSTHYTFEERQWGDATYMVAVADGIALIEPIYVPPTGRQDIPIQPDEIAACSASR